MISIVVIRENDDKLRRCVWRFIFDRNVMRLVNFANEARQTTRHKWRVVSYWSAYGRSYDDILPQPARDFEIERLAVEELVHGLSFAVGFERNK
jgi:hypothetical protein